MFAMRGTEVGNIGISPASSPVAEASLCSLDVVKLPMSFYARESKESIRNALCPDEVYRSQLAKDARQKLVGEHGQPSKTRLSSVA